MSINSFKQRVYFDDFVLDRAQRSLRRNGREIPLRPKTYSVLTCLIDNCERVVPRDELLSGVWRGLRVEPQAVFQSVSELRAAFGRHDFIRTVRGVGYQWVAPTTCSAPERNGGRGPLTRRWAIAAAGLMLSVGAAWFALADRDFWRDFGELDARVEMAYARFEQGDSQQAHRLARDAWGDAVAAGAERPRMVSAALLSRSPLLDRVSAEYFAHEAIDFGNRLREPDFAAAGHERLGELLLDRGERELAAMHWNEALENYTDVCPSGVERVRGLLASSRL